MRRAVVNVNLDPDGALDTETLLDVIAALRDRDVPVIADDVEKLPATRREVELLILGTDRDTVSAIALNECTAVLGRCASGVKPRAGAVAFMSAGTHEDAVGVVRGFGLGEALRHLELEDDMNAVAVFAPGALSSVGLGKLQTALEAALNRDVRLTEL